MDTSIVRRLDQRCMDITHKGVVICTEELSNQGAVVLKDTDLGHIPVYVVIVLSLPNQKQRIFPSPILLWILLWIDQQEPVSRKNTNVEELKQR